MQKIYELSFGYTIRKDSVKILIKNLKCYTPSDL
jgi:hypothetical protein